MSSTVKANQWLRRFQLDITSNSRRVYANGRQQVEITVTLEPRNGQTISRESLDSLALVQIDDEGIPRVLDQPDLYAHTQRDERFIYHNATGSAPSALLASSSKSVHRRFYVTSKRPGGTLSPIYAAIWMDEDHLFVTNAEPFKSSVVIESIAPALGHKELFQLSVESPLKYKLPSDNLNYWDDEFEESVGYFGFADPRTMVVQSEALATPSSHPIYEMNAWDHALISFQLTNDYSQHRKVTVYEAGQPFTVKSPESDRVHHQRPGHLLIHMYAKRFYNRHYSSSQTKRSIWKVIDQHGNGYEVEFFVAEAGKHVSFKVNASQA
ncbi:hypothetical protein LOY42_21170 [Pseudomonas sp. B21-023]|uniref:hypothetical protein n=1 Tax=Pseudomonas sp. B21-023 TaxID=2895477 RepID=UPI002160FE42|nr:hypothetical protein [Pseudomonas sp. B21-023]UVM15755.1 hypothetical protein LOY42_21170 [Pseudomonas sp. B21-023]